MRREEVYTDKSQSDGIPVAAKRVNSLKSHSDAITDDHILFTYRGNSNFISTGGSRRDAT
jgi:hypothetical protein